VAATAQLTTQKLSCRLRRLQVPLVGFRKKARSPPDAADSVTSAVVFVVLHE
jgi:hypothetical protein